MLVVDSMGGVMPSLDGRSAFAHNRALFHIHFSLYFDQQTSASDVNTQACDAWMQSLYDAVGEAGVSDSAYRNYPSADLPEWQRKYFGASYPRLHHVANFASDFEMDHIIKTSFQHMK